MMKEKNVLSSISQNQEWKDFGSTQQDREGDFS